MDVLGHEGPMGTLNDQVGLIKEYMATFESPITLLVHSLDGPALRQEKIQSLLGDLASISLIRMVCSIDHLNSSLMWDMLKLSRFNFCWHDTSTFEPLIVETSFENRMIKSHTKVNSALGALHVLNTLNENSRKVFKVLLEYQLEQESDDVPGLSYSLYFRKVNEAFIASTEIAFKTQLTEFKDHHLIVSKRSNDQTEVLCIPFSNEVLKDICEQL